MQRVNLSLSNISQAQKKYLVKDQFKSDSATCLLASDGSAGATGEYLKLWRAAGRRVNDPRPGDKCFISANGARRGRMPPPKALIRKAVAMRCEFLTDAHCHRPEGGNRYNIGEQAVADLLRALGYKENITDHYMVALWTKKG